MASVCVRRFGWHDSYTYSKALAELAAVRAAEQHGLPMLILRPTIVESAMREPAPCVSRSPGVLTVRTEYADVSPHSARLRHHVQCCTTTSRLAVTAGR